MDIVFFDFSKAFDKLDYIILTQKLFNIGMSEQLIKLIINFITGRSYILKMDGQITEERIKPKSGVPQGSHIGPLLYLIYCNDIQQYINEHCKCKSLAIR